LESYAKTFDKAISDQLKWLIFHAIPPILRPVTSWSC